MDISIRLTVLVCKIGERWRFDAMATEYIHKFITETAAMSETINSKEYYIKIAIRCNLEASKLAKQVGHDDYGFMFWYIRNEFEDEASTTLSIDDFKSYNDSVGKFPPVIAFTFKFFRKFHELIREGDWKQHTQMELLVKPKYKKIFRTADFATDNFRSTKLYGVIETILEEPVNLNYIEEIVTDAYPTKLTGIVTLKPGQTRFIITWIPRRIKIIESMLEVPIILMLNDRMTDIHYVKFRMQQLRLSRHNPIVIETVKHAAIGNVSINDVVGILNLWECKCHDCDCNLVGDDFVLTKYSTKAGFNVRNLVPICAECDDNDIDMNAVD
jgi:hypothetical protein